MTKQRGRSEPRCPIHDVPLSGGDQCPTCFAEPEGSGSDDV